MASYQDGFGNVVSEGDIVIWTPSEGNGLALRRVIEIKSEQRQHAYPTRPVRTWTVITVKVCPVGKEDVPATYRTINHGNAVRWPDQDAKTDRG